MLAHIAVSAWAIPLAALTVSVATFVFSVREMRRRARVDYVAELEHRIKECEDDRMDLRRKLDDVRDENLRLMRRLTRLENGH